MVWPFGGKKKEDEELAKFEKELGLGDRTGLESETAASPKDEPLLPKEPGSEEPFPSLTPEPTAQPVQQQPTSSPDLQVISAKLDTLKSMLELVNQRIEALERRSDEKKKMW